MKNSLFETLCCCLNVFACRENATQAIHCVLRSFHTHFNAAYSIVVLQNPENENLEIAHYNDVSMTVAHDFRRGIGNGPIGKLFYSEHVIEVCRKSPKEDYEDFLIDNPYEEVMASQIIFGRRTIGYIAVYFNESGKITHENKEFLQAICRIYSEALEVEELKDSVNQLRRYCPETGLLCPSFFLQKLGDEVPRSIRYNIPLTLAIMDNDNFKEILNLYGLQIAREMFKELADELKICIRGIDVLGIYGTDEFILFMPNTSMESSEIMIRRFQETLKVKKFTQKEVSTSFSFGMTEVVKSDTLDSLMKRVLSGLFKARCSGKGLLVKV
ncbi:MAG: GGDEF domain-containing protein [Candidatus Riflebacteria bacterium]|nr:GGDEF domain-containing protein [Candidatus Riflebacteria bacterium]